jgi:hypothetical protein
MEILLNELSLCGQFGSVGDFVGRGLTPFLAIISEINDHFANVILKKQNFWQSQVTFSETIHDIFVGKISRTNDEIRKSKSLLAALIAEPFWEDTQKHNSPDTYEFNENDIWGTSLAESCERDKVVISFIHKGFSSTNLSVSKNSTAIQIDNLFDSGHYFVMARSKGLRVSFSLKDTTLFAKTTRIEQGQSVFKKKSTNHSKAAQYWYLDNLHRNHYEIFDDGGNHFGVADLEGNITTTMKVAGRTIKI